MPEGPNKAKPGKGPGSVEGRARGGMLRRLRPGVYTLGGNEHSSMRARKNKGRNLGKDVASAAEMRAVSRGSNTVRNKPTKNRKGVVSKKVVKSHTSSAPTKNNDRVPRQGKERSSTPLAGRIRKEKNKQ